MAVEGEEAGVEVVFFEEGFGEDGGCVERVGESEGAGAFGFEAVGGDGGGAVVLGIIGDEGGIDEDGLFEGAGELNGLLAEGVGEETLVVIFEGEGVAGGEEVLEMGEELGFLFGGEGTGDFLVEAEHLLGVAVLCEADKADFGGGGAVGAAEDGVGVDLLGGEEIEEEASLEIVAAGGGDEDFGAEGGECGGDVAGAAGALFAVAFLDDGDGGLGGEAFGVAEDVFVDHDIAEEEDARAGEFFDEGDEGFGGGGHGGNSKW
jgi:hypothetical protein